MKLGVDSAMKIVIESPLSGPTPAHIRKNFRFLLWCCRAVWLEEGKHAIASHMLNPWFMDDTDPEERKAGIANPWVWDLSIPHMFFTDLGMSSGMEAALNRCRDFDIPSQSTTLRAYRPSCLEGFMGGTWPPRTPGFEIIR